MQKAQLQTSIREAYDSASGLVVSSLGFFLVSRWLKAFRPSSSCSRPRPLPRNCKLTPVACKFVRAGGPSIDDCLWLIVEKGFIWTSPVTGKTLRQNGFVPVPVIA